MRVCLVNFRMVNPLGLDGLSPMQSGTCEIRFVQFEANATRYLYGEADIMDGAEQFRQRGLKALERETTEPLKIVNECSVTIRIASNRGVYVSARAGLGRNITRDVQTFFHAHPLFTHLPFHGSKLE